MLSFVFDVAFGAAKGILRTRVAVRPVQVRVMEFRESIAVNLKGDFVMSKQEEAGLILKLYELRREETMRQARDWYFRDFNPQSMVDFNSAMFGAHSGHLRMVITYWDMAAPLVNDGAIRLELFNDVNGEQFGVFSKIEPLLTEIRADYSAQFGAQLEKLIAATPDGRKRVAAIRERMKSVRATLAQQQAQAKTAS
jgi:hypothetical protein